MGEERIQQIIKGGEIILRPYKEDSDEEPFYRMLVGDLSFRESLGIAEKGKEFKRRYLEGKMTLFDSTGEFGFVIERNLDKAIMGFIVLDNNYGYSHRVLTLSYFMGEPYRRQGYMEKALRMVIDHGFRGKLYQLDINSQRHRRYSIHAFKAKVDIDNVPSMRLLEKLGFTRGGVEYCETSLDGWPVKDRVHYYLENPAHPPKRP